MLEATGIFQVNLKHTLSMLQIYFKYTSSILQPLEQSVPQTCFSSNFQKGMIFPFRKESIIINHQLLICVNKSSYYFGTSERSVGNEFENQCNL